MPEILKQVLIKAVNKLLMSRVSSNQKIQLYKLRSEIVSMSAVRYEEIRSIKFMGPKTYKLVMEIVLRCFGHEVDLMNPVFLGISGNPSGVEYYNLGREEDLTVLNTVIYNTYDTATSDAETLKTDSNNTLKKESDEKKTKRITKRDKYIPPYNSTPYKILKLFNALTQMGLEKLSRKQIQQKLPSDINSSLKSLIKRGCLNLEERKYSLTERGQFLCTSLFKDLKIITENFTINNITLIIDSRETKSKREQTFFQEEFLKRDIQISTRNLSVGDFTWIIKIEEEEFLIPFLIERKCTQDFLASINSKRMYEQLSRLKRYKNIFYLIETSGYKNLSDSDKTLFNEKANILKQSGLIVLEAKNINESVELIYALDSQIRRSFYSQPPMDELINYDLFELEASKNLNQTGRDVFKTLLLSIKGYSGDIEFILNSFKNLKDFFMKIKNKEYVDSIISQDPEFRKILDMF